MPGTSVCFPLNSFCIVKQLFSEDYLIYICFALLNKQYSLIYIILKNCDGKYTKVLKFLLKVVTAKAENVIILYFYLS